MKVSYFASSRADIFLGEFVTSTVKSLDCCEAPVDRRMETSTRLRRWDPSEKRKVTFAGVFISGLRTSKTSIPQLEIASQLNPSTGELVAVISLSKTTNI